MYYLVPREYMVHSSSKTGMGVCAINVQRAMGTIGILLSAFV